MKANKNFKIADLIISQEYLLLLDYKKGKFKIITQLYLVDIKHIDINKCSCSFTINHKEKVPLEIKTRSFSALADFLKFLKRNSNKNTL